MIVERIRTDCVLNILGRLPFNNENVFGATNETHEAHTDEGKRECFFADNFIVARMYPSGVFFSGCRYHRHETRNYIPKPPLPNNRNRIFCSSCYYGFYYFTVFLVCRVVTDPSSALQRQMACERSRCYVRRLTLEQYCWVH